MFLTYVCVWGSGSYFGIGDNEICVPCGKEVRINPHTLEMIVDKTLIQLDTDQLWGRVFHPREVPQGQHWLPIDY